MTLNTSGPISLGGSTTGESIALELNQSATSIISLNDANVRQLAGVPSGTIIVPTNFYGKSAGPVYGVQQAVIQGTPNTTTESLAQASSVALSADGNTAVITAPGSAGNPNPVQGKAWIFVRSGSTWTQQYGPFVGSGAAVNAGFGSSAGMSDDGNTVAISASKQGQHGAFWVFTRSGSTWSQQAGPITPTGGGGNFWTINKIALSGDGNTLVTGAVFNTNPATNAQVGGIWIFVRSGSTWSQQAGPLWDPAYPYANWGLGGAVALSQDGNTVAAGASYSTDGGVWVWTRSGSTWSLQSGKLFGTGGTPYYNRGSSVALSSDGNTLAAGAREDGLRTGAVWIFTRSGSTWSQQGPKLVGSPLVTAESYQGQSVSLSGDGNILAVGATRDNQFNNPPDVSTGRGAVWIFSRSGSTWSQSQKVLNPDQTTSIWFGNSVALSRNDGSTLLVGNPGVGTTYTNPIGYAVAFTKTN